MSTLSEITYSILGTISGGDRISDDQNLSIEAVQFSIINNRALLLRNDLNKGHSVSDNVLQTLPCIVVEQIDRSLCPCNVPTDCTILRSSIQLPKFLEIYQKDYITKVSGVDILGPGFSIISFARASKAGSSKWTANSTKAFFHNQYLYLLSAPNLTKVSVQGILENPMDASTFTTCSGDACFTADSTFPISKYMIPTLKDMVLKDLKIEISVPSDQEGNESQKTQSQQSK